MKDKKELIQEVLKLELEIPTKLSREEILRDLSEWFDEDIKKLRKEDFFMLFNQYIDDLYLYLVDYSVEELEERAKALRGITLK
jgi:hypothetical protein